MLEYNEKASFNCFLNRVIDKLNKKKNLRKNKWDIRITIGYSVPVIRILSLEEYEIEEDRYEISISSKYFPYEIQYKFNTEKELIGYRIWKNELYSWDYDLNDEEREK